MTGDDRSDQAVVATPRKSKHSSVTASVLRCLAPEANDDAVAPAPKSPRRGTSVSGAPRRMNSGGAASAGAIVDSALLLVTDPPQEVPVVPSACLRHHRAPALPRPAPPLVRATGEARARSEDTRLHEAAASSGSKPGVVAAFSLDEPAAAGAAGSKTVDAHGPLASQPRPADCQREPVDARNCEVANPTAKRRKRARQTRQHTAASLHALLTDPVAPPVQIGGSSSSVGGSAAVRIRDERPP